MIIFEDVVLGGGSYEGILFLCWCCRSFLIVSSKFAHTQIISLQNPVGAVNNYWSISNCCTHSNYYSTFPCIFLYLSTKTCSALLTYRSGASLTAVLTLPLLFYFPLYAYMLFCTHCRVSTLLVDKFTTTQISPSLLNKTRSVLSVTTYIQDHQASLTLLVLLSTLLLSHIRLYTLQSKYSF